MNFSPTYTLESKANPGVTVTLRRLGPKRRAEIELSIAAARAKHSDCLLAITRENAALQKALDALPEYRAKLEAGARAADLMWMIPVEAYNSSGSIQRAENEALAVERAQIHPAYVRACVKSIDGIEIEDGTYTVDMLCDEGPDELFDEVIAAINRNGYFPKEQAENLSLPTTSGDREDGGPTNTTALSASPDSTSMSA